MSDDIELDTSIKNEIAALNEHTKAPEEPSIEEIVPEKVQQEEPKPLSRIEEMALKHKPKLSKLC